MSRYGELKDWLRRSLAIRRVKVAILMYHRVHAASSDPWNLCVSPRHFNEHMEHLRGHFTLLRLGQLVELLAAGRLPSPAAAVTFDDGYADNLRNAKPILESHGVPATVFVVSGAVGQSHEFWWDELHRLLLEPGKLPEVLQLRLDSRAIEWNLEGSGNYTEEECRRHRGWRADQNGDPTPRHALFRFVYALLRPLPQSARRLMLDQLSSWAHTTHDRSQDNRTLSPDELIELEEGGLVDIGAHTVTHPVLSGLPAAAQALEITQGRLQLEEILGHAVSHFSYPHGQYTAETVALVKQSAFVSACSSQTGLVRHDSDSFRLPRIQIGDWSGQEFARRMATLTGKRTG